MEYHKTAEPADLYYEDFSEGQEMTSVEKGPMMVGHQVRWAGAADNYESEFHHDEYVAKERGLPGIILSGPLMGSYLITEVTKWLGRNARLISFQDRNVGPTMPRDQATITAKVVRKFMEGGKPMIEFECGVTNQKGSVTTPGGGIATIKSRAKH